MKVEVAALGSLSLLSLVVSVDVKQHLKMKSLCRYGWCRLGACRVAAACLTACQSIQHPLHHHHHPYPTPTPTPTLPPNPPKYKINKREKAIDPGVESANSPSDDHCCKARLEVPRVQRGVCGGGGWRGGVAARGGRQGQLGAVTFATSLKPSSPKFTPNTQRTKVSFASFLLQSFILLSWKKTDRLLFRSSSWAGIAQWLERRTRD